MAFVTVLYNPTNFITPPTTITVSNTAQNQITLGLGSGLNATAMVMAGPQLDELQPVGPTLTVSNGFFHSSPITVSNTSLFQTLYCAIYVENVDYFYPYYPSTVVTFPLRPGTGFKFPIIAEWPEPSLYPDYPGGDFQQTNLVRTPGENVTFSETFFSENLYGIPTVQWRKDGKAIPSATNNVQVPDPDFGYPVYLITSTFTVTNIQASDAGVYDLEMFGDNWLIAPKITVAVQLTNGPGVFKSPRFNGSNFLSDLVGAPTRNYTIQWSTNLSTWNDLLTLSNTTGTLTFTNATASNTAYFYRTKLLP